MVPDNETVRLLEAIKVILDICLANSKRLNTLEAQVNELRGHGTGLET